MSNFTEFENQYVRRELLPWWIKVFCWIFMISGIGAIISMLFSLIGIQTQLSIYGINDSDTIFWKKALIYILFLFHGITAYMLWYQKKHAVTIGILNAILGILICLIVMMFGIIKGSLNIRLELILLILFFLKLYNIKPQWG